ncbi:hypothetical protein GKC30_07930 [Pseudodesulfovibrio sp. F-1]|uniref:Uncharacterized protein n=1 Tax=Pseudodesulfovibrio alkaliphilus TaxID=2661613 RepID=A0A7K1KNE8_9BACT|nr:hypothetical protein [Pseudodesulfovibrio alkaliphilus]MUM77557.1 hypothetical protein [Pseudodesulfovibrio alkaliphilus]
MRTLFLTLLLLLATASGALALDTYDDAPAPASLQQDLEPAGHDESDEAAARQDEPQPDTGQTSDTDPDRMREAAEGFDPDQEPAPARSGYVSVIKDDLRLEPLGTMTLRDGTILEIMDFVKLGKFYIYLSGKLNSRSSTVVSFTRLSDLQMWASITFRDQHTLTVVDRGRKEMFFTEARLYLGTDSPNTFTFTTLNRNNFQPETAVVYKRDVASITIN